MVGFNAFDVDRVLVEALRREGAEWASELAADAFSSSRLAGDWGSSFGTLPRGTDFGRIIDRHRAV
jgi:hypothetical protein